MKSIQTKILFVVIAGLMVITAIVSTIAVSMTHEIMHKDADRILENATQKEAAKINDVLGDVVKSCNIMTHYAATEITNAAQLKDEAFRVNYIAKAEVMLTEAALNTSGVEGFYMRLDPALSNGTTGFYKIINSDYTLKDMPVTDLLSYEKEDKKNVGWYYEAVNKKDGVWLEPYSFPGTDNELITFAQPIYVNDELVGVIGFDMDFSYLISKINAIRVYEYGYISLLAADGKTRYNDTPIVNSDNPQAESKEQLKNGMFLVMHADYKDIQKDIHPMLTNIVLAFIIVFLAALIYTVFVTRKIVGPLKRLTAAVEGVTKATEGSAVPEIAVETNDEIGTLSKVLSDTYSQLKEYTSYINALAYRDSLTGIKNNTAYAETIAELNREIMTGKPKFGVVVADINNLKDTNDAYGHDIGNELIVRTAKILVNTFTNSAVYRIGGDEFAVILKNEDYSKYRELLQKMDEACSSDFITVIDKKIPIRVARGVALYSPEIDSVYEDVFSKADHAMYLNKEESKTAFV